MGHAHLELRERRVHMPKRMGHLCRYCQKSFSRSYNRDHHERQSCFNYLQEEQEGSLTMNGAFPEVETDEEEELEDEEIRDDEDKDESMDSHDEDDEETVDNDSQSDSSDPWENLRAEVRDALNPSYVKQVERFLGKGASRAVAKAKALNVLLSAHRRKLRRLYVYYLKWFRHLTCDPVHQEVMNTLRHFMDEESMDYEFWCLWLGRGLGTIPPTSGRDVNSLSFINIQWHESEVRVTLITMQQHESEVNWSKLAYTTTLFDI